MAQTVKNLLASGRLRSDRLSGRSPGEGNGYPLHYSCLGKSMDRGAWWPIVHGVTKSWKQLRDFHLKINNNYLWCWDFVGGSDGKASTCNVGDLGSIPGLARSPGEGNGNPLQYPCLEKSHGQGSLLGCSPESRKESGMTERLTLTLLCIRPIRFVY